MSESDPTPEEIRQKLADMLCINLPGDDIDQQLREAADKIGGFVRSKVAALLRGIATNPTNDLQIIKNMLEQPRKEPSFVEKVRKELDKIESINADFLAARFPDIDFDTVESKLDTLNMGQSTAGRHVPREQRAKEIFIANLSKIFIALRDIRDGEPVGEAYQGIPQPTHEAKIEGAVAELHHLLSEIYEEEWDAV